jgi:hypothetical protein
MSRASVAVPAVASAAGWPLLTLAVAASCKDPPPSQPGPAYTPATADMLKALAADCELQPGPEGGEVRSCRGRQATMRIEIDTEQRIRDLDMTVTAASGTWEAWTLYKNVLPPVTGPAVTEVARRKLAGELATDPPGIRVATLIDGPRYSVRITWGR